MRTYIQIRVFMLILFCGTWCAIHAQSSPAAPAQNASSLYRWQKTEPAVKLPSTAAYSNLPEADYTPAKSDINEWSSARQLQSFAEGLSGNLSVTLMLSVDEEGYIRKAEILKASNTGQAQSLLAIMVNSKISGPSYSHNKAVAAYVPCEVTITHRQISIL
jgi:hypothetical protein